MTNFLEFRQRIMDRQQELRTISEHAVEGRARVELDQTRVGRLSRMDAMQSQQMNIEAERRRDRELIGLVAALKRIEAGEFGECISCGEEINPKRLEIDLTATRCIQCAEKTEN